jgi:hypothetical protein
VRAYVTHTGEDKLVTHRCGLGGAVFEQQPAAVLEVRTRPVDDDLQAGELITPGGERAPRLVRKLSQVRIVGGDVGRVAHQQLEALPL